MQSTILLNSSENTHQVEAEEQGRFVYSILSSFGLPLDDWQGEELTPEQHIGLRKVLFAYGFDIISDMDGGVKIYLRDDNTKENSLVAEFKKPHYILRKDAGQPNPNKRLYLEMITNTWSILEETE
jgi:hypothetical protein